MNNNITLVSAFYDIGRENFKSFPRSAEKYLEYFKRWARIKNNLIFFCANKAMADKVLSIRADYGLKDKTIIIIKEDIETVDSDLLHKFESIENCNHFKKFREVRETPENKAMYNYIMFLKFYFIQQASLLKNVDSRYLAWIDFGFEHGGDVFEDANDYDFEWEFDFGDRVNFFYLEPIDSRPIFEICRIVHADCFMGATFIVPKDKAEALYQLIKQLENFMADIGLMDDDQIFLNLASRVAPDLIQAKRSSWWFMPISEYSNHSFKLKERKKNKEGLIVKFKKIVKKILKIK